MSHTDRLKRAPDTFRQLTGLTPAAFDGLFAQLQPRYQQADARRKDRPLLKGGDPAEILRGLHATRAPFYAEAPIHVTSNDGPHHDTALQIIEAIDQWL